jgi:hypothetical protein
MTKHLIEAIKVLISSLLIFISFFIWYIFWNEKNIFKIKTLEEKKHYIKVEKLKTKINLYPWRNVIIINNWIEYSSWNLILE